MAFESIELKRDEVYLVGEWNEGLTVKQYIDLIEGMIDKLDEIDPNGVYRREWEEK